MYVFMYTSLKNSGVAKTFIKAEDGLFDLRKRRQILQSIKKFWVVSFITARSSENFNKSSLKNRRIF